MYTKSRHRLLVIYSLIFLFAAGQVLNLDVAAQTNTSLDPNTVVSSDGITYSTSHETLTGLEENDSYSGTGLPYDPNLKAEPEQNIIPLDNYEPSTVIGSDGRSQVDDTTKYPYRAIAYLRIKFPKSTNTYRCTGWFFGKRIVGTAGHCLYSSTRGGWASSITVYPGRSGDSIPYGSTTAHRLFSVVGWIEDRDIDYDYGAIQTNSDLGETVGWFGFRWQSSDNFEGRYRITGYPADKPGVTMWTMLGEIRKVKSHRLFYRIDTFGGQSGSPIYRNKNEDCAPCPMSIGYHTYGTHNNVDGYNSGTRITEGVFDNMVEWKKWPYP